MRLSEINYIINKLTIDGHHLLEEYIGGVNSMYDIRNIKKFKILIQEIEEFNIDFYKAEISIIKKNLIYETTADKLRVPSEARNALIGSSSLIINSLNSLKIVLERITPEKNENSFLIKLPYTNNFEEITKDMSKIQKQLQLILSDEKIDSSMEIKNWEYGSYWIDIAINTQIALSVLGSITYAAAYIVKEIRKDQEHRAYIERLSISTQSIQDLQEAQKKHLDGLYNLEILDIQNKHYSNEPNPERNKKIKDTIKLFAELINKGGEFQPSLIAPEKMKKNFPDLKNIENLESPVAKIPEETESGH